MGLEWAMQSRSYALASILLLVALGYGVTDERGRQANARFWRRVDELGRGGDPGCALALFGVGYGGHEICNASIVHNPCIFHSFGIEQDFSFDLHVARQWNCRGVLLDPTVQHPEHPGNAQGLTFLKIGANSPVTRSKWTSTNVPLLGLALGHPHLHILKMDCEGCEYQLAADIAKTRPNFFRHVDQFAFELHTCEGLSPPGEQAANAIYSLFAFLFEAGHDLRHFDRTRCSKHSSLRTDFAGWNHSYFPSDRPRIDAHGRYVRPWVWCCYNILFTRDRSQISLNGLPGP